MDTRVVRGSAVAIAAAISLAACGNAASEEPESSTGTTMSPLAELMGWQNDSPEESRRKQLEVENLTAECMREEGWEYTPVDWSAQMPDQDDEDMALMNDMEAFGKKYGYGIVRNYEQWEEPQLNGEEPGMVDKGAIEDPNQEYVSSLSESENAEYYESLYGKQSMVSETTVSGGDDVDAVDIDADPVSDTATAGTAPAVAPRPVSPEDQGCAGRANAEVYGTDPTQTNPDLQARMNDHWEDSQNDPRLLSANDEWLECMADIVDGIEVAGQPITKPEQMYSYVDRLKYEAMGLEIVPFDQNDAEGEYYTAWSDDEGKGEAAVGEPEPIPEAELEELRTTELELWESDWGCQQEVDFDGIRRQIEQELVDELRAEFPELGSGES
jgi:hypothetical protein